MTDGQNRDQDALRREAVMNRVAEAASAMTDYRQILASANRWRESYNPLRGMDIQRAISLLEEGERGAYADLQWLYRHIEMQDATLGALIERRISAVEEMDWSVGISDAVSSQVEMELALKQQAALKDLYAGIGNMQQAIAELCMASFRGFTHLEKVYEGGALTKLDPIPQWHWCRDGLSGAWELNIDSRSGATRGTPVDLSRLVIREVSRPINRVALVAFIRKSMSQKDWDGFVETFGIPAIFLFLPPELGDTERSAFQEVAESIISDARGVLPGNSKIQTIDNGARGANPFRDHIKYQDEQLVLRGTGGKLTMLAESGSGTLAGGAHSDTFQTIARAEARKISELFREAVDKPFLENIFPGRPVLARFEIAANEETDVGSVIDGTAKLNAAGYKVSPVWLQDKTGYELEQKLKAATVEPPSADPAVWNILGKALRNREASEPSQALAALEMARAEDHAGIIDMLKLALAESDDAAMGKKLSEVYEGLVNQVGETPEMEAAWEQMIMAAMAEGFQL